MLNSAKVAWFDGTKESTMKGASMKTVLFNEVYLNDSTYVVEEGYASTKSAAFALLYCT